MSDLTITLLILVVAVVLFVWNRLPVGIVALGVALSLWATGVLTLDESLAGFGSPTVVFIASLFVVAEALDASGITTWAGQQVIAHAGDSQTRLLVLTMLTGALLSALITPNGAAAALIPMVVILAVRSRLSPSRLLMPLAFSAHAGSLLALTGSPVNVLISEAASDVGGSGLRFFEFARVGVPLLVGTILIVVLLGPRLLTERGAKTLPRDLSQLPRTLLRQYIQEADFARLEVSPASSLVGLSGEALDLRPYANVHVIGVLDSRGQPLSDAAMSAGSVLVVRGQHDDIERFATDHALSVQASPANGSVGYGLVSREYGVAEVIVTPRSAYVGTTVFPGMVTESGELVILAVQRQGEDLGPGEARIKAGDSLLLQGTWAALDEQTRDANVLLVDSPDAIRRQTAPLGPQAMRALVVLAAMAMLLLGVVTVEQAHRSLSWTTLILVAGMIPLSTAITQTGAADLLAGAIVNVVGGAGPYALLLGVFLIAAVLGQLISNTATALILIPIAVSIATETGTSPLPLLMCVSVASAAALLTPVATPANMMVMGPGGYQFTDYAKLGLPILLLYLVVAVFLVSVWWPW